MDTTTETQIKIYERHSEKKIKKILKFDRRNISLSFYFSIVSISSVEDIKRALGNMPLKNNLSPHIGQKETKAEKKVNRLTKVTHHQINFQAIE